MIVTVNQHYSYNKKGMGDWEEIDLTLTFEAGDVYTAPNGIDLTTVFRNGKVLRDPALTQAWPIRRLVDHGGDVLNVSVISGHLVLETVRKDADPSLLLSMAELANQTNISAYPAIRLMVIGPRGNPN
jgi:hypothetical protein